MLGAFIGLSSAAVSLDTEQSIVKYINNAELKLQEESTKNTFAAWAYESNITDETQAASLLAQEKYDTLSKEIGFMAQKIDASKIKDEVVKRKVKLLSNVGVTILPLDKIKGFNKLKSDMGSTYSKAKVKEFSDKEKDYSLEPELTKEMAQNRDPKMLGYYWTQWREQSGKKIRDQYKEYVDVYNEAAKLNGYKDGSHMKIVDYESKTFKDEMEVTWQGLKPLYQHLHAYVRTKLNKFYGDKVVSKSGPLPAHLMGNMWAQSWNNLADLLTPYPDKPSINVTGAMVDQGWNQKLMFEKAEEFFESIGLKSMPEEFWSGSIIKKPDDGRDLTCHASAWDFYNGKDFRIKQCTAIDQSDFETVNHEMGHIQYFLQYKKQPYLFRNGANPGFHEAVADILALAVNTPNSYQRLGLLPMDVNIEDEETNINILLAKALDRIAFLPFGYLIDKFRWDVYAGVTSQENMNCHWWKLRHEIQGLEPPTKRSYKDFDAGSKYHVAADVPYVRYFTAFIYQFQFYRSMCLASGKYDPKDPKKPLHRCDFHGSTEAGDKLREMLKLGSSKPWKEAMEVMTGQPEMSTGAIREYFKPLEDWLIKENARAGVKVGWGDLDLDNVCDQSPAATFRARLSDLVG